MHIPKKRSSGFFNNRKRLAALLSVLLLAAIWNYFNNLSKDTVVAKDEVIIATVEKGDLIREVRAPGVMVPKEVNYITALSSGMVRSIPLQASDRVTIGTIVMTLENPELMQALDSAQFELETQNAAFRALAQRLHQDTLKQRILVADFKARYEMALLNKNAYQELSDTGAASKIKLDEYTLMEKQLKEQLRLEHERLASLPNLHDAELRAARAAVKKSQRHLELQQQLVDGLEVRAGTNGILQEILLEEGEQVMSGTLLARVADQESLKAELKVQESQIKHIQKGLQVTISAGGHTAQGLVKRIDPAVQEGVVLVDVHFPDKPLADAMPDLRVEGAIKLEHLVSVLKLKRPVFTPEYSSRALFVLNSQSNRATKKRIKFGRGSLDVIEVVEMLKEGDQVIVSDLSKYAETDEIRLN